MDPTDLCFAGAAAQARLVRSRDVSPSELVDVTLARIDEINPSLNAYNVVLADQARADAAAADDVVVRDRGGPLLGVLVAVKDTIDLAGHITSYGTTAYRSVAAADSPLVESLRAAGAIVVGKTACSELAVWPFTETSAWGATRNPWDLRYSPGGSSGGAGAATAAGLCGLAIGSDGLGSIRVPAGFTGVFGLKPQRGRVWHKPGGWKGMAVNGPLCRTVEDAALFLDVAGDGDESFQRLLDRPLRRLRIAMAFKSAAYYPFTALLGAEERGAVESTAEVLRQLGHTVIEREVGFPSDMSTNYVVRYLTGVADNYAELEVPDAVSTRTQHMAAMGRRIPDRVLQFVIDGEAKLAERVNRIFEDFDLVLTPGAVQEPLKVGALDGRGAIRTLFASGRRIPNFAPWNAIGQPAVSVPAGFSRLGLPLSVQLAGGPRDESTLLAAAAELEAARPWAHDRPAMRGA